jgi:alpha/beta hydrolase family protein
VRLLHLANRVILAAMLLAVLSSPSIVARAADQLQLPEVRGPIANTATSKAFLGGMADLDAVGYVEEEYFLSGNANVYEWGGSGRDVRTIAGPAKYTNRILVRRPRDPARFSGNIEVEVLNASLGVDGAGTLMAFSDLMLRQGDVWIGMTSKPVVARALQKFDPKRYAALDWSNPAPPGARCAKPTLIPLFMYGPAGPGSSPTRSMPETEDGLVWDMIGQLGMLLKSEERNRILPGFSKPMTFLAGTSQSSLYIRAWITAFHDRYRMADGAPLYDGFLGLVLPAIARINQCSADVALDDPRNRIVPPEVPYIDISSEGEMWIGAHTRQSDAVTPKGGIVTYEIAGGSHGWGAIPGTSYGRGIASPDDMAKAGVDMAARARPAEGPDFIRNDLPWIPIIRASLRNLQLWARDGVMPPQAPPLKLDASLNIQRDCHGNALGGLRLPYIDVPTSSHRGSLAKGGAMSIVGLRTPFSAETLRALYPDHATYVAKFSAATDRMVAQRWILPDDAEAMKKAAQAAKVPE